MAEEQVTGDQWIFLVDPEWQPSIADSDAPQNADQDVEREIERPPLAAVVGGWLVTADGSISRFHPNPDYEPATPDSPTDPVDAALRLTAKGEVDVDALFSVIRESKFGVALDGADRPLIAAAPDEVTCLLVTTSPAHRDRVGAQGWRDVSAGDLVRLLQDNGVDALFNPGATTSTRLMAEAMGRELAAIEEEAFGTAEASVTADAADVAAEAAQTAEG
jgi:hypothetical protein